MYRGVHLAMHGDVLVAACAVVLSCLLRMLCSAHIDSFAGVYCSCSCA